MPDVHTLAGARGWAWRIEHDTRRGNAARRHGVVQLSRPVARGRTMLTAVRPHEAISAIPIDAGLRPAGVPQALDAAAAAARAQHAAFGAHTAQRLRGDIHAWQLCAALAFERGHARVLLADEAGMGKTISAAIAIAQCLDEAPDRRCLILAPGHLLRQWRGELDTRMGIPAAIVDAASMRRMVHEIPAGIPPWSLPGCLLASIDFLKQSHIRRSLETSVWDLLVIDEAHMVCGLSDRHDAARMIARRARRVLLLTATPSDGGVDRLRALMTLGAGPREAPPICVRHVAAGRTRVERTLLLRMSSAEQSLHTALAAYCAWIRSARTADQAAVELLASVLIKRALSSSHALHLSLVRREALLDRAPLEVQPSLFDPDDDPGVIGAASGQPIDRERRRLRALITLADRAARGDRRLKALLRLVRRARESVVVFSCFRDTAAMLAGALSPHVRTRLIHGALAPAATEAALDAFTSGGADVLVATDVASQGLNLHARCRWVIHYDLPWRPPVVQQRAGRVDRLGQTQRVHVTTMAARAPLEEVMRARLAGLDNRMRAHEQISARRWDVLAEAEAGRLRAARATSCVSSWPMPHDALTILETDIGDARGVVIDRRVSVAGAHEAEARRWGHALIAAHTPRLQRRLAARASRRVAREHAVREAALETIGRGLRQDGLFDRRTDRGRADDATARLRIETAHREACDEHVAAARIARSDVRVMATFTRTRAAQP